MRSNHAVGGMPVAEAPCPLTPPICGGGRYAWLHSLRGAIMVCGGPGVCATPEERHHQCPHIALAAAQQEAARLRERLVEARAKLIAWRLFSTSLSAPDPHYEENVVEGIFRPYRDGRVHPQSEALRTQARRELGFPDPRDDGKVPAPPSSGEGCPETCPCGGAWGRRAMVIGTPQDGPCPWRAVRETARRLAEVEERMRAVLLIDAEDYRFVVTRLAAVVMERNALRDAAALALAWFERGGMSAGEIEGAALRAALASASPTAPAPKGGEGA